MNRPATSFGRIFFPVLLLLLPTAASWSQRLPLDVRLAGGDTLKTRPGAFLAVPVQLTNIDSVSVSVRVGIDVSSGWRTLSSPSILTLARSATEVVLPILAVPKDARAGIHEYSVRVYADGDESTANFRSGRIIVERIFRTEVTLTDAPRFSVSGEPLTLTYSVANKGNDSVSVLVNGRSTLGFESSLDRNRAVLPPSGAAAFTATISVPPGGQKVQHSYVFSASVEPGGEPIILSTVTEVIPRATSAAPPRKNFPLFATLRGTGESGQRGMQLELAGAGPLSEDGQDRFEVLLRGPETQTFSPLGYRDEYRARYKTGGTEIYGGDWNYALTPLTEVGRYATGIGGRGSIGEFSMGGFANQTRHGFSPQREVAGWVRYPVAEGSQAGLNLLRKTGRVDATIVTLSGETIPFENSSLDVEGGRSSGTSAAGYAYAVRLNGALPWGVYDLRTVRADPNYAGYYRDVSFSAISVTGFASREIRTEFTARTERRNLNSDTLRGGSPTSGFLQIGAGYHNYFAVSFRTTGQTDPYVVFPRDTRENVVQLRSTYGFSYVTVSAYADFGSLRDRTLGTVSPSSRYAVSASGSPLPGQSYSASIELSRNRDLFSGNDIQRVTGSVSASYLIGPRTRADLSLYTSKATGIQQQYSLFDAALDHVFPTNHRAAFRYRRSQFTGTGPSHAVSVEYGVPLYAPLGVRQDAGGIRGNVIGADGRGMADVLVSVGASAALSDTDGSFALPNLPPGVGYLTIDRATIGLDRTTTVPLPLELNIPGGEEIVVNIHVVQSATVRGEFLLFDFDPSAPVDSSVLTQRVMDPSIILAVEINNGVEFHRRRTDSRGRFVFTDLRPGTWMLSVLELALPPDHFVEIPQMTFELPPGGSVGQSLRILPKRKTIRIIQEGGILQATPAVAPETEQPYGRYIIRHAPARGGYFAQVSAFAVETIAIQEAERMRKVTERPGNIRSVERAGEAKYYRVEVGPFASAREARRFCDSIPE